MSIIKFPSKNNEVIEYLENIISKLKENKIEDFFCGYLEKNKKEELPAGDAVIITNDAFRLLGLLFTAMIDTYIDLKIKNIEELDG